MVQGLQSCTLCTPHLSADPETPCLVCLRASRRREGGRPHRCQERSAVNVDSGLFTAVDPSPCRLLEGRPGGRRRLPHLF